MKIWQWKTADNSIRTSIEMDEIKLELINDKIIECKDFNKRLGIVYSRWHNNPKTGINECIETRVKYTVPEFGYYYENN